MKDIYNYLTCKEKLLSSGTPVWMMFFEGAIKRSKDET